MRSSILTCSAAAGVLTTAFGLAMRPAWSEPISEPITETPPPLIITPQIALDGGWSEVTLAAVGDVSLARELNERMRTEGAGYPFELVQPLMDADLLVGNLEGALTAATVAWPKAYRFSTPPGLTNGLQEAGFDVVSLANNHTMDFGAEGLIETMATLDIIGIAHTGAGRTAAEAHAPVIVESEGLKLAFLSFVLTPRESSGFSICTWAAGPVEPGLALGSVEAIGVAVLAAQSRSDFVIVQLHAGTEYAHAVDLTQVKLVEAAVAAGADVVLGTHSHAIQPITWGGAGTPFIAWGLGNFVFDLDPVDLANMPVPRVSLVLHLTIREGVGVTAWEARPVLLDDTEDRPRPATKAEAAVVSERLAAKRVHLPESANCPSP